MDDDDEMRALWREGADYFEQELQSASLPGILIGESPSGFQREDLMEVELAARGLHIYKFRQLRNVIHVVSRDPDLLPEQLEAILKSEGVEGRNIHRL